MTGPWAERPVENYSSSHRDHALNVAVECVPYDRRLLRSVWGDPLDYPTLPVAHHIAHTCSQRPVITAGPRRIPYKRPVTSTRSSTTFCTARFRAPVRGHQGFLILGGTTPPVVEGVVHHDGNRACGLGGLQGAHHLRGIPRLPRPRPRQYRRSSPTSATTAPGSASVVRSRTPATSAPIRLPLPFHHVSRFARQNQPGNGFSGVLPHTPSRLERGCSAGAGWGNDNADPRSRRGLLVEYRERSIRRRHARIPRSRHHPAHLLRVVHGIQPVGSSRYPEPIHRPEKARPPILIVGPGLSCGTNSSRWSPRVRSRDRAPSR